jgi:hypothetical protein
MSKRVPSILFLLATPLIMWSAVGDKFTASSTEGVAISFTVYNETEKTAWVSPNAVNTATEGVLTIPSIANGYTITGVYNVAFKNCDKLTSIIFPSTITSFQYYESSFNGCSANVVVDAENPKYFSRNGALYENSYGSFTLLFAGGGCTSFIVENDVNTIFNGAFYNSTKLEQVIFEAASTSISFSGWSNYYSAAFKNCPLKKVEINRPMYMANSNITLPFYGNSSLEEIELGTAIQTLDDNMFYNCSNLSTINIFGNVYSIGYRVFEGTEWKKNALSENGIKYIGSLAIAYDGTTKDVSFKGNTSCISDGLFSGANLGSVELPNSISIIPKGMFLLSSIDELTIPANVERIAYNAFYTSMGYTRIGQLVIEDSDNPLIIESSYDAKSTSFRKATITSLIFGRAMTIAQVSGVEQDYSHPFGEATISKATITRDIDISGLFFNCKVNEVELPEDMSAIGDYAFYGCNYLSKVIAKPSTPPIVSSTAFNNSSYRSASLYVPFGCKDSYYNSDYWGNFKSILYYNADNVSMSANKLGTYCSTSDLDFTKVTGLKAYIVSGFSPSTCTLTLTPVTTVRAGEGLLLKGNEGEYIVPHTTTDMYYSNLLVGVPSTISISPIDGEYTNFILANGSHGINFYTLSEAGNIAGGKAYLHIPTSELPSNARSFKFDFGEDISGINSNLNMPSVDAAFYDLQGRKVNQPSKGLYIVNGKKVILK